MKNKPLTLFICVLSLVAFSISIEAFSHNSGELTIAFLDIGQGDAIYIKSPSGVQVLIDGGRGKQVLRELGAVMGSFDRSIDIIIATHPDQDHIGGLPFVLDTYEVDTVIRSGFVSGTKTYKAFGEAILKEGAESFIAEKGMIIHLGEGVHLDILFTYPDSSDANDASVIARLVYDESEVLLTGDAPKWVEGKILGQYGENLKSDILKVGHHGSKTSSASAFIETVDPDIAILSYGERNRYGHPSKEVISILDLFGIEKRHTPDGRIVCRTDGKEWVCD